MRIIAWFVVAFTLAGCVAKQAPNGMTWQEYRAAKHRLQVVYRADQVAACQELGFYRGSDNYDISAAKEEVAEQAVLLGGDTVYFENLYSKWQPFRLFGPEEIFYAEGRIFSCGE